MGHFIDYKTAVQSKYVWEIWPIKLDFGWPNAKIGCKMAKGQLLFLALE